MHFLLSSKPNTRILGLHVHFSATSQTLGKIGKLSKHENGFWNGQNTPETSYKPHTFVHFLEPTIIPRPFHRAVLASRKCRPQIVALCPRVFVSSWLVSPGLLCALSFAGFRSRIARGSLTLCFCLS